MSTSAPVDVGDLVTAVYRETGERGIQSVLHALTATATATATAALHTGSRWPADPIAWV
jgi:hypothetical protein